MGKRANTGTAPLTTNALVRGERRTAWHYLTHAIRRDPQRIFSKRMLALGLAVSLGRVGDTIVEGASRVRHHAPWSSGMTDSDEGTLADDAEI